MKHITLSPFHLTYLTERKGWGYSILLIHLEAYSSPYLLLTASSSLWSKFKLIYFICPYPLGKVIGLRVGSHNTYYLWPVWFLANWLDQVEFFLRFLDQEIEEEVIFCRVLKLRVNLPDVIFLASRRKFYL